MLNIVLYQPDIPQNLGALLRLSACMGCHVHIIEPCGFPLDDTKLRRAGMDYITRARYTRHLSWQTFLQYRAGEESRGQISTEGRLLLLETDGATRYTDIAYQREDYIVLGSEGTGTPAALYGQMDMTLTIPMREGVRSLNVAMSAGMLVAEACRQYNWDWEK